MPDSSDIKWEIEFFEGVVEASPDCCEALKALADLYTRAGRYRDGLELDLKLAELLPDDALVHYNLACSHSLTGALDAAVAALSRAVELGYLELDWMEQDSDLDNIRHDDRYHAVAQRIREIVGQ